MRAIRLLPFTAIGVVTIALFFVLELLGPAAREQHIWRAVIVVERVLIIPIWLMRIVVVRIGIGVFGAGGGFPVWFNVLTIPILLVPHLAADLLLFQRRAVRRSPA